MISKHFKNLHCNDLITCFFCDHSLPLWNKNIQTGLECDTCQTIYYFTNDLLELIIIDIGDFCVDFSDRKELSINSTSFDLTFFFFPIIKIDYFILKYKNSEIMNYLNNLLILR